MRLIAKILLLVFVVSWTGSVSAAATSAGTTKDTLAEYLEARRIYIAAAACVAAYSSRTGSLAAAAFEEAGWHVEPHKEVSAKADVKYLVAWDSGSQLDRDRYLLAIAGTENARDAKVDMRTKKVYFAGTTLEEFAVNAARNDLPPDVPRVHEGFNQVAQLLITAEASQANDDKAGMLRTLANILKEDHEDKVYLVGHSLGGAVVTLTAARLLDMGVNTKQVEVITFGAPAVGNEAFEQKYDGKFAVTRIVVADDPVPYALRKVFGGYRHIGQEVVWPATGPLQTYFSHDVPVYMDLAAKRYYLARRTAINEGVLAPSEPVAGKNRIFVAPVKNSLPSALQSEFAVMQEALWDEYDQVLPGHVADSGEKSTSTNLEKAAAAGCTLLVVPEIQAVRVRDENTYYVSLNHTVYRVADGETLSVGLFGSNTKTLTPLGALIHGARSMRQESPSWANVK